MEEKEFFLGWQMLMPGAAKRIWHIIDRFGSPAEAWKSSEKQLTLTGGFTAEGARELVLRRRGINPEAELLLIEKKGVRYIHYVDSAYPEALKNIFDPPPGIFVRGNISFEGPAVAVVGSRKATRYGLSVAEKLAGDLALAGVTVVSGMARGIDTAAHRGALAAGAPTVAVLGCGVDVVYPKENSRLMEDIAVNGAVVSEFPLGMMPQPWHFPVRNRIISGLSGGVVIVEAAERSGALITADFALDQGRDVFAVPGNITSELSRGPNRLIRQGATPVENAGDILEVMGLERLFRVEEPRREDSRAAPGIKLSPEEEMVRKLLSIDPSTLDRLVDGSGLSAQKVLAALTFLEMKGLARQLPGKLYILAG
ncbi:MAG: DNA-processing protein DprA [Bacillota bacterium]